MRVAVKETSQYPWFIRPFFLETKKKIRCSTSARVSVGKSAQVICIGSHFVWRDRSKKFTRGSCLALTSNGTSVTDQLVSFLR